MTTPNSVKKTITVSAPREVCFRVFTQKMGAWWPLATHKIGPGKAVDSVIEPKTGGRWFEKGEDGSECQIGHVLAWEPPSRVVLGWQLTGEWKFDPNFVTEVEVRFVADGPTRTIVELEHRNLDRYGDKAAEVVKSIGSDQGWLSIMDDFRKFAEGAPATN